MNFSFIPSTVWIIWIRIYLKLITFYSEKSLLNSQSSPKKMSSWTWQKLCELDYFIQFLPYARKKAKRFSFGFSIAFFLVRLDFTLWWLESDLSIPIALLNMWRSKHWNRQIDAFVNSLWIFLWNNLQIKDEEQLKLFCQRCETCFLSWNKLNSG